MIQIDRKLWIGDSKSPSQCLKVNTECVLNVAQDLPILISWPIVEYAQVGLIDGPGNPIGLYHAAILTLMSLQKKGVTLVCCHDGGRSLAIGIMYLNLIYPSGTSSSYTNGCGWDGWINILSKRIKEELPKVHEIHKEIFDKIQWRFLSSIIGMD